MSNVRAVDLCRERQGLRTLNRSDAWSLDRQVRRRCHHRAGPSPIKCESSGTEEGQDELRGNTKIGLEQSQCHGEVAHAVGQRVSSAVEAGGALTPCCSWSCAWQEFGTRGGMGQV